MRRARRRSVYCDPVNWARIGERAADAGMTISAFIITCGLEEAAAECPGAGLHLTEDEQRSLFHMMVRQDRYSRAMLEPIPDIGMSGLEALLVLERLHRSKM